MQYILTTLELTKNITLTILFIFIYIYIYIYIYMYILHRLLQPYYRHIELRTQTLTDNAYRHRGSLTSIQKCRHIDEQLYKHTNNTEMHTYRYIGVQKYSHMSIQDYNYVDMHTLLQTCRYIFRYTDMYYILYTGVYYIY